ncbi:MAG TPA: PqiC family protein [Acetobacteraceae bacterium]|jgi:hypothetical protein
MRRGVSALPLLLILAACGRSPTTHFYTLVPEPAAQTIHPAAAGPPVQVGRVMLPGELDRLSIVTRGPGAQVDVSGQDRWVAPLDELVQRALTEDLRERLGGSRVLAPGDRQPPGGVLTLALNVQQFSADRSGQVILDADWMLVGGRSRKPASNHHVTLHVDAGSGRSDAVAAAMSRALGQLADRIAAAL